MLHPSTQTNSTWFCLILKTNFIHLNIQGIKNWDRFLQTSIPILLFVCEGQIPKFLLFRAIMIITRLTISTSSIPPQPEQPWFFVLIFPSSLNVLGKELGNLGNLIGTLWEHIGNKGKKPKNLTPPHPLPKKKKIRLFVSAC